MASFRYRSLTAQGTSQQGVIAAPNRAAAVRLLGARGETPTLLELADGESRGSGNGNGPAAPPRPPVTAGRAAPPTALAAALPSVFGRGRPAAGRAETAALVRELATALEAGLTVMQALRTVRRQATGKAMTAMLDWFLERVEAGAPLHQAAAEYGPPFDDLIVGMLRAADASGRTSEVLHQLADLLERSVELRREVIGATLYPMIVAGLVLVSATILVTVLVPRLIEPLAGEMRMPLPTRILMGVASFLQGNWFYGVAGIAAMVIGWRLWVRLPANRLRVDHLKLKSPIGGKLLRDVAVARFTRTLGTLASAGIPILDALRITRDTLGNAALMQAIDQVQERVTSGAALADPLERSGLFPPLLVQVVNLGERSGRLEGMLIHAAVAFDRQVNTSVKLFTRALPPVLIIIMAVLGSFVLAAILLPLLELHSVVQ
jgi:type II secretory pathway component PulF